MKLHLKSPPLSKLMLRGRVYIYIYIYMAALGGQDPGQNRLFLRFPRALWMCETLALSPFPLKDTTTPLPPTLPIDCMLRVNA